MVAVMDAPNFKMGVRDYISGLRVPLENGEAGQPFVRRRDGDCAAAVDDGLIHMSNHRLGEGGEG